MPCHHMNFTGMLTNLLSAFLTASYNPSGDYFKGGHNNAHLIYDHIGPHPITGTPAPGVMGKCREINNFWYTSPTDATYQV